MWRGEQGEARIDDNSREGNWLGGGAAMWGKRPLGEGRRREGDGNTGIAEKGAEVLGGEQCGKGLPGSRRPHRRASTGKRGWKSWRQTESRQQNRPPSSPHLGILPSHLRAHLSIQSTYADLDDSCWRMASPPAPTTGPWTCCSCGWAGRKAVPTVLPDRHFAIDYWEDQAILIILIPANMYLALTLCQSLTNILTKILMLWSSFYRRGNRSTEKLSKLPMATQVIGSGGRTWTQDAYLHSQVLLGTGPRTHSHCTGNNAYCALTSLPWISRMIN